MKSIYKLFALTAFATCIAACDPLEDIYSEIDSMDNPVVKNQDEYVLTASDYESISKLAGKDAQNEAESQLAANVKTYNALNSFAAADKYVPEILKNLYPSWGKGSTVGVTYNILIEENEALEPYRNISSYKLSDKDYSDIWSGDGINVSYLSPKHSPSEVIPSLLKKAYSESKSGDLCLVDYRYDENDPQYVAGEDIMKEGFDNDFDIDKQGWNQLLSEGKTNWGVKTFNNNGYLQVSARKTGEKVENWLITPSYLISSEDASFTFDLKFGYFNGDCLSVYVSDSYNGESKIDISKWTDITDKFVFPKGNPSGYTDFENVGSYALSSFVGKNVSFAFVYRGEDKVVTTTVQLDNVMITTSKISEANDKPYNILYRYDGEKWSNVIDENVILVSPSDYDSMGTPGQHDNFSSTDKPENYLPTYLSMKYPYSQNGDYKIVVYKYYESKVTSVVAAQYVYEGSWAPFSNIAVREKETFLHNGERWLFDPTITVDLTKEDYEYLVSWVKENKPDYIDKSYDNTEYWFGASSHYLNFNIQLVKRRSYDIDKILPADDAEARIYLESMVAEGASMILSHNYPDAPVQMNGVDLYYNVNCKVYDGAGTYKYIYRFKSLGKGKFELSGDPEISKW